MMKIITYQVNTSVVLSPERIGMNYTRKRISVLDRNTPGLVGEFFLLGSDCYGKREMFGAYQ